MGSEPHHGKDDSRADDRSASSNGGSAPTPAFMYVHYLTEDENPPFPVYLFQIVDPSSMQTEIKTAIDEILGGAATPVRAGSMGVEWRVFSYAVFVLNDANSELTYVDFWHDGTSNNHTFDYRGMVPRYRDCTVLYYLNSRKNKNNRALGNNEKDLIRWEAHHSHMAGPLAGIPVTHTSSDPNTGP